MRADALAVPQRGRHVPDLVRTERVERVRHDASSVTACGLAPQRAGELADAVGVDDGQSLGVPVPVG